MLIKGKDMQTIWLSPDKKYVELIDQRFLPFKLVIEKIETHEKMATAIKEMHLRGAPLIGVAASYGLYLALLNYKGTTDLETYVIQSAKLLEETRPTAVNLKWALNRQLNLLKNYHSLDDKCWQASLLAEKIKEEDMAICKNIGLHGIKIVEEISRKKKGRPVNILTHCNAGALACVDFGTATSLIYEAKKRQIPIHVWVDETRPRNQGRLTSWELSQADISNKVICDNTGGHLMQQGMVDIVVVGSDRTVANGDVANKIGTYLKALAAKDNNIPFYVALPLSTVDLTIKEGKDIPIEERDEEEVLLLDGLYQDDVIRINLFASGTKALNYGFDVTPARLVAGLITEKGIYQPAEIAKAFM